jgi:hypothetical protein
MKTTNEQADPDSRKYIDLRTKAMMLILLPVLLTAKKNRLFRTERACLQNKLF